MENQCVLVNKTELIEAYNNIYNYLLENAGKPIDLKTNEDFKALVGIAWSMQVLRPDLIDKRSAQQINEWYELVFPNNQVGGRNRYVRNKARKNKKTRKHYIRGGTDNNTPSIKQKATAHILASTVFGVGAYLTLVTISPYVLKYFESAALRSGALLRPCSSPLDYTQGAISSWTGLGKTCAQVDAYNTTLLKSSIGRFLPGPLQEALKVAGYTVVYEFILNNIVMKINSLPCFQAEKAAEEAVERIVSEATVKAQTEFTPALSSAEGAEGEAAEAAEVAEAAEGAEVAEAVEAAEAAEAAEAVEATEAEEAEEAEVVPESRYKRGRTDIMTSRTKRSRHGGRSKRCASKKHNMKKYKMKSHTRKVNRKK